VLIFNDCGFISYAKFYSFFLWSILKQIVGYICVANPLNRLLKGRSGRGIERWAQDQEDLGSNMGGASNMLYDVFVNIYQLIVSGVMYAVIYCFSLYTC